MSSSIGCGRAPKSPRSARLVWSVLLSVGLCLLCSSTVIGSTVTTTASTTSANSTSSGTSNSTAEPLELLCINRLSGGGNKSEELHCTRSIEAEYNVTLDHHSRPLPSSNYSTWCNARFAFGVCLNEASCRVCSAKESNAMRSYFKKNTAWLHSELNCTVASEPNRWCQDNMTTSTHANGPTSKKATTPRDKKRYTTSSKAKTTLYIVVSIIVGLIMGTIISICLYCYLLANDEKEQASGKQEQKEKHKKSGKSWSSGDKKRFIVLTNILDGKVKSETGQVKSKSVADLKSKKGQLSGGKSKASATSPTTMKSAVSKAPTLTATTTTTNVLASKSNAARVQSKKVASKKSSKVTGKSKLNISRKKSSNTGSVAKQKSKSNKNKESSSDAALRA